jgi:hypothetical protein
MEFNETSIKEINNMILEICHRRFYRSLFKRILKQYLMWFLKYVTVYLEKFNETDIKEIYNIILEIFQSRS